MQGHGSKRTPEEWKVKKKEEAAIRDEHTRSLCNRTPAQDAVQPPTQTYSMNMQDSSISRVAQEPTPAQKSEGSRKRHADLSGVACDSAPYAIGASLRAGDLSGSGIYSDTYSTPIPLHRYSDIPDETHEKALERGHFNPCAQLNPSDARVYHEQGSQRSAHLVLTRPSVHQSTFSTEHSPYGVDVPAHFWIPPARQNRGYSYPKDPAEHNGRQAWSEFSGEVEMLWAALAGR
ncbi:hypothetical protein LTR09_012387 [Extremus antarcticus]|uniref:Uncharacterized protein n=1 Tax=Extremus antarcticus TaxID=702011 RepID=A0AAJ0DA05_9PEZI|nr:hypothetical protein LTR09_012387 [Extremus antarcticus]